MSIYNKITMKNISLLNIFQYDEFNNPFLDIGCIIPIPKIISDKFYDDKIFSDWKKKFWNNNDILSRCKILYRDSIIFITKEQLPDAFISTLMTLSINKIITLTQYNDSEKELWKGRLTIYNNKLQIIQNIPENDAKEICKINFY